MERISQTPKWPVLVVGFGRRNSELNTFGTILISSDEK
jgi:hypothetical protein